MFTPSEIWEDFRSRPAGLKKTDHVLLEAWCMAACYSTDEDGTVRLPFDPATSELIPEVGSAGSRGILCEWCPATPTPSAQ
jgi:hypothetical protein